MLYLKNLEFLFALFELQCSQGDLWHLSIVRISTKKEKIFINVL